MAFLMLVAVQAAHSVEETVGGLQDVFAPARLVSGLVSDDHAVGFAVANAAIVAFGLWCWAGPVRGGWSIARSLTLGWVVVEVANGFTHMAMAVARGEYFPGVITAPLLLLAAGWLAVNLERGRP